MHAPRVVLQTTVRFRGLFVKEISFALLEEPLDIEILCFWMEPEQPEDPEL